MGTSKPKIQCYIDQSLFDLFEAERHEWGLSQSQAWERILSERYNQDAGSVQDLSDERLVFRVRNLEESFASLAANFIELKLLFLKASPDTCLPDKLLEITSDTPSDTLQITGDTPSDTLQITSDTSSDTPSDTSEITGDTPSDTSEITGDTPSDTSEITSDTSSDTSEITSDTLQITSDTPSDTLQITSDTPSDTLQITSDTPSDTLQITSDTPTNLLSHPLLHRFIICRIYERGICQYWSEQGFTTALGGAKLYENTKYVDKQINKLKAGGFEENIKATFAANLISKSSLPLEKLIEGWEEGEARIQAIRQKRRQKNLGSK